MKNPRPAFFIIVALGLLGQEIPGNVGEKTDVFREQPKSFAVAGYSEPGLTEGINDRTIGLAHIAFFDKTLREKTCRGFFKVGRCFHHNRGFKRGLRDRRRKKDKKEKDN